MRDENGRSPLAFGIKNSDIEMVKALCKGQYNLRDCQDRMYDAMEWAVEVSALNVLRFLLDISPQSINKPDKYGRTLTHMAARKKSLEVLTLLESGAAVNVSDGAKRTPLHDAAHWESVQTVQKLIESGANVNEADEDEQTPLHWAAEVNNTMGLAVLIEANASINVRDREQRTPLHLATHHGHIRVVERLLKENADIHTVDDRGRSPLHTAAVNAWMAIAKLFLENGASPDQVDGSSDTALRLAIESLDASTVQLMLDRGADVKIKGRDGHSCLGLASGYGLATALEMLFDVGSSSASGTDWDFKDVVAAYWEAIINQSIKTFEVLVKKERRLLDELSGERFTSLETCLYNRGECGEEELIAIHLLELGAEPFKRHMVDRKSGFELGIITRGKVKEKFIDCCLERISKDLSSNTFDLGFKELRIVAELDKPELWGKLKPLREAASNVTDHDGWTLDHFIHQSATRLPMQLKDALALKPTRTPTGLVLPPMWARPWIQTKDLVETAPSKLQASFACK